MNDLLEVLVALEVAAIPRRKNPMPSTRFIYPDDPRWTGKDAKPMTEPIGTVEPLVQLHVGDRFYIEGEPVRLVALYEDDWLIERGHDSEHEPSFDGGDR